MYDLNFAKTSSIFSKKHQFFAYFFCGAIFEIITLVPRRGHETADELLDD
jgi:hypothetical protein